MDPSLKSEIDQFQQYLDNNEHSFRSAACLNKSQIDHTRKLEQCRDSFAALKEKVYQSVTDLNISAYVKPKNKDLRVDADTVQHISKMKEACVKLS